MKTSKYTGKRRRVPLLRRRPVADDEYDVGYGKPPLHTRFKPGRTGNPKGRPKRHRNFKTVLEQVLEETIAIREGDRERTLPRIEVLVRTVVNRALQGDAKAMQNLIVLIRAFGGPALAGDEVGAEAVAAVTHEDEALVAGFLRRFGSTLKDVGSAEGTSLSSDGESQSRGGMP
jgi:hypothetical protein